MAVILAATSRALAVEIPSELLSGLTSDSYPERVAAEKKLQDWASEEGDDARQSLLKLSKDSDEPEIRRRAFAALRAVVVKSLTDQRPGFVGIRMASVKLSDEVEEGGIGVEVQFVNPNTPAEKAGLKVTDVILKLDGKGWTEQEAEHEFAGRVGEKRGGDRIRLEILREGKRQEIELELIARPWSAGTYSQNLKQALKFRRDPFAAPSRFSLNEEGAEEEAFQKWLQGQE